MFKSSNPAAGGSFLPTEYVEARAEHRANFLAVLMFMIIMGGVVTAFLVTNRRWQAVRAQDEQITLAYEREAGKIQQLHELENRQAEIAEKAEIVNALHEHYGRSVLLAEINTRRPNDDLDILELKLEGKRLKAATGDPKAQAKSQVRNLSQSASVNDKNQADAQSRPRIEPPRYEHTLKLVGVSKDNASITDYLASLAESALLRDVELKTIEETVIEKEDFRKFEIVAKLVENVDPEALDLARYRSGGVETVSGDEDSSEAGEDASSEGRDLANAPHDEVSDGEMTLRSIFAAFGDKED